MSRSYRKHVWLTQGYGTRTRKWMKREANHRVRRAMDVPNHKAYRKYFDSWSICDWKFPYDPYPERVWWYSSTGEPELLGPWCPPWKARAK